MDALLQRMFENDLSPEDLAESDEPGGNIDNPAFSSA